MQFSIPAAILSQGLKLVSRAIPKRAARPILQNVMISANGAIELAGTDLEVGTRRVLEGTLSKAGEIMVPAARLATIIKGAKGELVTFKGADGKLEVSWTRRRFSLQGEDVADFPVIPQYPAGKGLRIDAAAFRELVKRISFACAAEESRYAIHGVLISVKSGRVTFVGTDGKRLAIQTGSVIPWPRHGTEKETGSFEALIPSRVLADIVAAMPKGAKDLGDVSILPEDNRVLFQYGGATFVASKIDGTFPTWEEVVPSKFEYRISMNSADLEGALKDVATMASEGSQSVSLAFGGALLTVGAQALNVGACQADVPLELDAGIEIDPITVHFNPKYLIDYLKASESPEVTFEMSDARSAVKLTDETDGCYVLMPITLEDAS
ncbi:MAG: DNA polymerase III subunit beta [Planctomycetota bacterium]|nr:DNA polymerase III subunit beta [Planctomycetota bacterium]